MKSPVGTVEAERGVGRVVHRGREGMLDRIAVNRSEERASAQLGSHLLALGQPRRADFVGKVKIAILQTGTGKGVGSTLATLDQRESNGDRRASGPHRIDGLEAGAAGGDGVVDDGSRAMRLKSTLDLLLEAVGLGLFADEEAPQII